MSENEKKDILPDSNENTDNQVSEAACESADSPKADLSAKAEVSKDEGGVASVIADIDKIVKGEEKLKKGRSPIENKLKKAVSVGISLLPGMLCFAFIVLSLLKNRRVVWKEVYTVYFAVMCVIMAASFFIGIIKPKIHPVVGWAFWAITPAVTMYLAEWMCRILFAVDLFTVPTNIILLNLAAYYIIALFFLFVTRSAFWSTVITAAPLCALGIANYYVVAFRGTVIFPWDLASIGTAASVADNYSFAFPYQMAILVVAVIFMFQFTFIAKVKLFAKKIWLRCICAVLTLAIGLGYGAYLRTEDVVKRFNLYPYLFTPNTLYTKNGMAVSLLYSLQFLTVEKPEGYSADGIGEMMEGFEGVEPSEDSKKPNIIAIMNEAFSDPRILADIATAPELFPYTSKLTENTVKGFLNVSVCGGNTPNSEFEFLSGSSMAFLPAGSIPYQQFIKGEMPTLVSMLEDKGYSTAAMHPYWRTGWDRHKIYDYFGFDKIMFKDDFENPEMIRSYISDKTTFDKIIELYESKDSNPMFVFDVTMQNHGGYKGTVQNNFKPNIVLSKGGSSGALNEYLSLLRISDIAFGELVEYFKKAEEPTVILMFGDHQPHDNVVSPMYKSEGRKLPPDDLKELADRYRVPFFIWANYDIEEKSDIEISANYLSALLCQVADVGLSPQLEYLTELREKYPVITANCFADSEGNLHSAAEIEEIPEFNEYARLQYNLIFDKKNRLDGLYK